MKSVLLLMIALTSYALKAQTLEGSVTLRRHDIISVVDDTLGYNFVTGRDIVGKHYSLNKPIYDYYVDTTRGFYTFHLRALALNKDYYSDRATILQYYPSEDMCLWRFKYDTDVGEAVQTDQSLLYCSNSIRRLNPFNGTYLWDTKHKMFMINYKWNIGLGYPKNQERIDGIDLNTGEVLWSKERDRVKIGQEYMILNDSLMATAGANLNTINFKDGSGWSFTKPIVYHANSISSSYYTDDALCMTQDSLHLYYFNSISFTCHNKENGKVLWSVRHSECKPSMTILFQNDTVIYSLENGYSNQGDLHKRNGGVPLLSAYHKKNGKVLYTVELGVTKDYIVDALTLHDTLTLLFEKKIAKYSLTDGELLSAAAFDVQVHGKFSGIMFPQIFMRDGEVFTPVYDKYTQQLFVNTRFDHLLRIDENLQLVGEFNPPCMYIEMFTNDSLTYYSGDDTIFVIDESEKLISKFAGSSKLKMIGDKLYVKSEKEFYEIDISQIIE